MDLEQLRKLVIISMFADDQLLERFVLKGGSAIDIALRIDSRSSRDVDLSMPGDFSPGEIEDMTRRIEDSLNRVFLENGYIVFDFKFRPRPQTSVNKPEFWGGYLIEFKIIPESEKSKLENIKFARVTAIPVDSKGTKKFPIDISKYEYCGEIKVIELDGYSINVYSEKMLVIEKMRALCQHMAEYTYNNGNEKEPRSKDFYDIYQIVNQREINFADEDFDLLDKVFNAKNVPIELLKYIPRYKEQYEENLVYIKDTLPVGKELLPFNTYYFFVIDLIERITKLKILEDTLK